MEIWCFIVKIQFYSKFNVKYPGRPSAEAVGAGFNPILVLIPMTL